MATDFSEFTIRSAAKQGQITFLRSCHLAACRLHNAGLSDSLNGGHVQTLLLNRGPS